MKPEASRLEVKGCGAVSADLLLHQARRGGKWHVGSNRSDDDEINLSRGDAGLFDGAQSGLRGEVGGEFGPWRRCGAP